MPHRSRLRRRVLVAGAALVVVAGLGAAGVAGFVALRLRASLPQLEGSAVLPGLASPATVERDALGVPRLTAATLEDGLRTLGYVHAQERFFQMDLLRRQPAGELAELLGAAALGADTEVRLHRMRARTEAVAGDLAGARRALFEAYRDGVNAGLAALEAPPFEYLLLGQEPAPWRLADSFLAVAAIYFVLNDQTGSREAASDALARALSPDLAAFLKPLGTEEDAPMLGAPVPTPPVPGPEAFAPADAGLSPATGAPQPNLGSNSFVLGPARAASGAPLVASDMHLPLGVPNIWHRAEIHLPDLRLAGLTLPGVPALVAGSNGHVAWGFTNTMGDWLDLIELETDPADPLRYRAPEGWRRMEVLEEEILVAGGASRIHEVRETIWGPVTTRWGRPFAVRWIAHDPEGFRTGYLDLVGARTVQDVLAAAHSAGMPPQNIVAADRDGRIVWSVAGPVPKRRGTLGALPESWADGARGWDGYHPPEDIPRVLDPDSGVLWTANNRIVDGEWLDRIGRDGAYAHGERALMIRDRLLAVEAAVEETLLGVQLDDRAPGLDRWRRYFLDALEGRDEPRAVEARRVLGAGWTGGAHIESAAYPLVRDARLALHRAVYGELTAPAADLLPGFSFGVATHWRGPLEKLVTERPSWYAPGGASDWDDALVQAVLTAAAGVDGPLADRVWGDENIVHLRHPLSAGLPGWLAWLVAPRLDAAPRPLPGDADLPRAQRGASGASNRFVVAPGREESGILHMPGGQSGHPASPYYLAGQVDWEEGRPSPFLAGPAVWTLVLEPAPDESGG